MESEQPEGISRHSYEIMRKFASLYQKGNHAVLLGALAGRSGEGFTLQEAREVAGALLGMKTGQYSEETAANLLDAIFKRSGNADSGFDSTRITKHIGGLLDEAIETVMGSEKER